jgi:hypothetical protein
MKNETLDIYRFSSMVHQTERATAAGHRSFSLSADCRYTCPSSGKIPLRTIELNSTTVLELGGIVGDRNTSLAVHVLILVFVVMPDREARTSRGRAWENVEKRREKLADLIVGWDRLSDRCEPLSCGIFSNDRVCIDGVLLVNELKKGLNSV